MANIQVSSSWMDTPMIAVIIDLIESRKMSQSRRRTTDKLIRKLLNNTYVRFEKYCQAIPSLTQGDSIELLVNHWTPIIFIFHSLLKNGLKFNVGFGTGKIIIKKKNADDCDGPAFWNAREAINIVKNRKQLRRGAEVVLDKNTPPEEKCTISNSILFLTSLLNLSPKQLQYSYYYIWEEKQITKIAKIVKSTKGNVSMVLNRSSCFLLDRMVSFYE